MRIALYHHSLPRPEAKPGGVEVFVDRLAAELARRDHDVTAFVYRAPAEPRPYDVRVLWPGAASDRRLLRHYALPWLFNVRRQFDTQFDVLHLHGDDWFYLRRRLPTVRTFHGSALMESLTATSRRRRINQAAIFRLERVAARHADAVYGVGPDARMLYGADGVLSCGVPLPDTPGDPAPEPTILFIGTWAGRKRGELLYRAFQEHVRPAFPDARLWMVSDHAPEGDGVTAFARPSDEEVQRLLRRAWLFCLPSAYEGLGIPYLEAMAHGVPVVATPNPGAEYVLAGGRFGELVEPPALGPALVGLLGDGERRAQLGAAGRERVRDFAWERLLDGYEAAYALAIERWRAARSAAA